jgi:Kiwa KwaB-like protein
MPDNLFAILENGDFRQISALPPVEAFVRLIFVNIGDAMIQGKEEVLFNGNYKIEADQILYVEMDISESFEGVINNPAGIPVLNLNNENIKTLLWYENDVFYFQTFDHRKILNNKGVLIYSNQTYTRLTDNAFVIDNVIHAVHQDERLYFRSYSNANRIFRLAEYYQEATNENIATFGQHENVIIENTQWLQDNANTVLRKHITLLQKSGTLDGMDTAKVKRGANKFKIKISLNGDGKIIFPSDTKTCRRILWYLNEQYYAGPITGKHYETNSKRLAD